MADSNMIGTYSRGNRNAWSRTRSCAGCGRIESVRKDNASARCKTCSGRENNGKALAIIKARKMIANCATCYAPFHTTLSKQAHGTKCCSWACRRENKSVPRTCIQCGAGFRVAQSLLGGNNNSSGTFCKRGCYVAYLKKPDEGQERGSSWKHTRTTAIRANPFCAECGSTSRLQAHHLMPYRLTQDNRQQNLVPLCRTHHYGAEAAFRACERIEGMDFDALWLSLRQAYDQKQQQQRAAAAEGLEPNV